MITGKNINPAFSMANPEFAPPKKDLLLTIYEDGEVEFEVDNTDNYSLVYVTLEEMKQLVAIAEKYVKDRRTYKKEEGLT